MPRDYVRNRPSSRSNQQRPSGGIVWLLAGVFIGLIVAGIFYIKNHPASSSSSQKNIPPVTASKVEASAAATLQTSNTSSVKNVEKEKPTTSQPNTAASQNLQTQFDFYNVLPGKNVTGPSGDEDDSAVKPVAQPKADANQNQPGATQTSDAQSDASTDDEHQTKDQTSGSNAASSKDDSDNASSSNDDEAETTASSVNPNPVMHAKTPAPTVLPKIKGYVLQVGIFNQYADADKLKAQLVLLGFDVKSATYSKNGKSFTRVWLGPYHTQDEAASVNDQLRENNISAKLLKSPS